MVLRAMGSSLPVHPGRPFLEGELKPALIESFLIATV
jgi:hypothetical protein